MNQSWSWCHLLVLDSVLSLSPFPLSLQSQKYPRTQCWLSFHVISPRPGITYRVYTNDSNEHLHLRHLLWTLTLKCLLEIGHFTVISLILKTIFLTSQFSLAQLSSTSLSPCLSSTAQPSALCKILKSESLPWFVLCWHISIIHIFFHLQILLNLSTSTIISHRTVAVAC